VFASFEVDGVSHELSTAIPALLEELKTIPYEAPPSA